MQTGKKQGRHFRKKVRQRDHRRKNEWQILRRLLTDAELELKYMEMYQEETERARKDNAGYARLWDMRAPSRQRIRDDLRMIRRVTMDIERGLGR